MGMGGGGLGTQSLALFREIPKGCSVLIFYGWPLREMKNPYSLSSRCFSGVEWPMVLILCSESCAEKVAKVSFFDFFSA